jgi:hypothetical protein
MAVLELSDEDWHRGMGTYLLDVIRRARLGTPIMQDLAHSFQDAARSDLQIFPDSLPTGHAARVPQRLPRGTEASRTFASVCGSNLPSPRRRHRRLITISRVRPRADDCRRRTTATKPGSARRFWLQRHRFSVRHTVGATLPLSYLSTGGHPTSAGTRRLVCPLALARRHRVTGNEPERGVPT